MYYLLVDSIETVESVGVRGNGYTFFRHWMNQASEARVSYLGKARKMFVCV